MCSKFGVEDAFGLREDRTVPEEAFNALMQGVDVTQAHAGRETPRGALRIQSAPQTMQSPGREPHHRQDGGHGERGKNKNGGWHELTSSTGCARRCTAVRSGQGW
jgi:hypothetical protein